MRADIQEEWRRKDDNTKESGNRNVGGTLQEVSKHFKRSDDHERCVYAECIKVESLYRIHSAGDFGEK